MTNGNDPAFPEYKLVETNGAWLDTKVGGLTKREYFAAMAMQGLLSVGLRELLSCTGKETVEMWLPRQCVNAADALIAELSKNEGGGK